MLQRVLQTTDLVACSISELFFKC